MTGVQTCALPISLRGFQHVELPEYEGNLWPYLNGFTTIAKTATWCSGAFSAEAILDPANVMTESEIEIQMRWRNAGRRLAVLPSCFVFHYRSIARGDQYKSEGAYRA